MRKYLANALLVICISFPHISCAETLSSLIDALATKDGSNRMWEDTKKIKGAKWEWPFYEIGEHESDDFNDYAFKMKGTMRVSKTGNPNLDWADISVLGNRGMLAKIRLSITFAPSGSFWGELTDFGKGKFFKLKTACDNEDALNNVSFYKFKKDGFQSLYIGSFYSSGASGSGSHDYVIAYTLEDVLEDAQPCD